MFTSHNKSEKFPFFCAKPLVHMKGSQSNCVLCKYTARKSQEQPQQKEDTYFSYSSWVLLCSPPQCILPHFVQARRWSSTCFSPSIWHNGHFCMKPESTPRSRFWFFSYHSGNRTNHIWVIPDYYHNIQTLKTCHISSNIFLFLIIPSHSVLLGSHGGIVISGQIQDGSSSLIVKVVAQQGVSSLLMMILGLIIDVVLVIFLVLDLSGLFLFGLEHLGLFKGLGADNSLEGGINVNLIERAID